MAEPQDRSASGPLRLPARDALIVTGRAIAIAAGAAPLASLGVLHASLTPSGLFLSRQPWVALKTVLALLPSGLVWMLPYALVVACLIPLRRSTRLPEPARLVSLLAAGLLVSVLNLSLLSTVVARTNQIYRSGVARLLEDERSRNLGLDLVPAAAVPAPGSHERTLPELLALIDATDPELKASDVELLRLELHTRLAVGLAPLFLVVFAGALRTRLASRMDLRTLLLLAAAGASIGMLHAILVDDIIARIRSGEVEATFVWLPNAVVLALAPLLWLGVQSADAKRPQKDVSVWIIPALLSALAAAGEGIYAALTLTGTTVVVFVLVVAASLGVAGWLVRSSWPRVHSPARVNLAAWATLAAIATSVGAAIWLVRSGGLRMASGPPADGYRSPEMGAVAALYDTDEQVQGRALEALLRMSGGPIAGLRPEDIVPFVTRDSAVLGSAGTALRLLAKMGPAARERGPLIQSMLTDHGLACTALATLESIGVATQADYHTVAVVLANSPYACDDESAVAAALGMGGELDVLLAALESHRRDGSVPSRIALALAATGLVPAAVRDQLVREIAARQYPDSTALRTLALLGPEAKAAIPALAEAVTSGNYQALVPLATIDLNRAAQVLSDEGVQNRLVNQRDYFIETIRQLGVPLTAVRTSLERMVFDSTQPDEARCSALAILARLGGAGPQHVDLAARWLTEGRTGCAIETLAEVPVRSDLYLGRAVEEFERSGGACSWLPLIARVATPAARAELLHQVKLGGSACYESIVRVGQAATPLRAGLIEAFHEIRASDDTLSRAIVAVGPIELAQLPALLSALYGNEERTSSVRLTTYLASWGDPDVVVALQWIGHPARVPTTVSRFDGLRALNILARVWTAAAAYPQVRQDIGVQVARLAQRAPFASSDATALRAFANQVRGTEPGTAAALDQEAQALTETRYSRIWIFAILGHAVVWLVLLAVVYPRSAMVRAWFWAPAVRRWLGLGYIGLLVHRIPALRRCILGPFRESLLADATEETFTADRYFTDIRVQLPGSSTSVNISDAIPAIQGLQVLEGESGSGKTVFLQRLARGSDRATAYLSARSCTNGVIDALRSRLPDVGADRAFLEALVRTGGLDLCIDGLNEVSQATRAQIEAFVVGHPSVNIIIGTQPRIGVHVSWAKHFHVQALSPTQALSFLISRNPTADADYADRCESFVARTFEVTTPALQSAMAKRLRKIASNPLDLTFIAEQLLNGREPRVPFLRQQQFEVIDLEYRDRTSGTPFPLGPLSDHVYQGKLIEHEWLDGDAFEQELELLESHRFVVSRPVRGEPKGTRWYFRHESILDFFVAHALMRHRNRIPSHALDVRFKGAYGTLALLLPDPDARLIRESLIEQMIESGEHGTVDEYLASYTLRTPSSPHPE